MRRKFIPLAAVPLLFTAALAAPPAHPADKVTDKAADSYAVYSAALPFGYHSPGRTVAIRSKTVPVPDLSDASNAVQREFAELQADPAIGPAVEQMIASPGNTELKRRFQIVDAYRLLDSDVLDGIIPKNNTPLGGKAAWTKFSQTYDQVDGLTEISAVGFNKAHTIAVFYAAHRAGTGCEDEGFEVLKKTGGRWRRLKEKGFSYAACY
jgi:hypothetical protein